MADKMDEIPYQRKLDRSPDSKEFYKLEKDDRRVVGQLRNAMEGVHQKVSALKEEVEEKELEISREQALRKAAESRLDQLVDMYGDPSVNRELQERLPKARKGQDIRDKWRDELIEIEKAINVESSRSDLLDGKTRDSSKGEKSVNFDEVEFQTKAGTKAKKTRSKSVDSRRCKQRLSSDDSESEGEGHSRYHKQHGYMPGYPGLAMPPYPGFYPPMYSAYPHAPPPLQTQLTSNMIPAPAQPQMVIAAQPAETIAPQSLTNTGTAANLPHATHPIAQSALQNTGKQDVLSPTSPGARENAASISESSLSAHQIAMNREQTKQISVLLAELDAAKNLNKKLQDKLSEVENEVEIKRIKQQTLEAETEEKLSGKIAAMVEEIYAAQKQRDEAMMNRMRTANEERDEALTKLKHLERSLDQLTESAELASDVPLKSVLSELQQAQTSEDLTVCGKQLVEAVNSRLRRQRQNNTEEMRAVLEERDTAVARSKHLEAEVLRLQRLGRVKEQDKENHATVQARLLATQQERDIALSRCQKLEEEIQTLRVYYSLHKSLSQEATLRHQFSDTLENMEGELRQRRDLVDMAQKENNRMAAQIQSLMADKQYLSQDLAKSQQAQKDALANQEKLERLVNVLRRKINGLGSKTEE